MSKKLNKLRNKFESLLREVIHKKFMLDYSYKEYERLEQKNKKLQAKLNAIAEFTAYDDRSSDVLVYKLEISKLQIRHIISAGLMVDYIIESFKAEFHKYIEAEYCGQTKK